MQDINKIFRQALLHFFDPASAKYGEQAALARKAGIVPSHLHDILVGRCGATEEKRRQFAAIFGYPDRLYDNFLEVGRCKLAGQPVPEPPNNFATPEDLADDEYFRVPLDQADRLGAGGIHSLGQAKPERKTTFLVHGPSLGRKNSRNLRAFVVGGDSMEPLIGDGGLVVADLTRNKLTDIKDGGIYVIGWDEEGSVKYLRWLEKDKLLAVESENNKFYKTVIKRPKDVTLIGQVIWSCRKHKI